VGSQASHPSHPHALCLKQAPHHRMTLGWPGFDSHPRAIFSFSSQRKPSAHLAIASPLVVGTALHGLTLEELLMAVWHGGRGASRLAARRCRPSNPIPPDLSPRRPLTIEAMEEVSDLAEFMRQAVPLLADDDPSDNAVLSHPTTFLNEAPCRGAVYMSRLAQMCLCTNICFHYLVI
jgi:hypothetical protein